MNRNFGIGILIVCFGFSSVNVSWATESMEISPIVVQPYGVQALNRQILDRDRQNRDEEIEIKELAEENDKLARANLAHQKDEGLSKINQTMLNYRDALLSRDRARIVANGEKWWTSRYGDLIALTEDADAMTVHQDLESKSGLLAEKYQMLTSLKDEMTDLNEKLKNRQDEALNQKEKIIEGYKEIAQEQQEKVQMLVERLNEMDRRISHFDLIIERKDQQIARLKDNLAMAQTEAATKDEMIKEQKAQIDMLQLQPKENPMPSTNRIDLSPIIVNPVNNQLQAAPATNPALAAKEDIIKSQSDQLAHLRNEISVKDEIIKQQKNLINMLQAKPKDHLASSTNEMELPPIIVNPVQAVQEGPMKSQSVQLSQLQNQISAKDGVIKQQEDQIAILKDRVQELSSKYEGKDEIIKQQESQLALLKSELEEVISKEDLNKSPSDQLARLQNEISVKDEIIKQQKHLINMLQAKPKEHLASSTNEMELPPIIVNPSSNQPQGAPGVNHLSSEQEELIKSQSDMLAHLQGEISAQDEIIKQQENQTALLKARLQELSSKYEVKNDQLDLLKSELENKIIKDKNQSQKDSVIKEQEDQIAFLKTKSQELSDKDEIIKEKNDQMVVLRSELDHRIAQEKNQGQRDETIKEQEGQIVSLKAQLNDLSSKNGLLKLQSDQLAKASEQFKNQSGLFANIQTEVMGLRNRLHQQGLDLKARDESIRWLNQVLAAAKNKAEYFKLTSQENQSALRQVKEQIQKIKEEFALRANDINQFENTITTYKDQVGHLNMQLTQKQGEVDQLKSDLENKVKEDKSKDQQEAQIQQDLRAKLQDKEDQIANLKKDILAGQNAKGELGSLKQQLAALEDKEDVLKQDLNAKLKGREDKIAILKEEILTILQKQTKNENDLRNASAQADDRVKLAKQLIALQEEEAGLLDEKSKLALQQYNIFDRHFDVFEDRMKVLLANHQIQTTDFLNQMEELKSELYQKEQQVQSLYAELKNKIVQGKNQSLLAEQVQELKSQLQDNENQILAMKKNIQEGRETREEADSLKQQLVGEQDKEVLLKQELDSKTVESEKLTAMIGEYQKKLESKDTAYNGQLSQVLSSKNYQAQLEKQIDVLNSQLQEKEAQVIGIKKDMYDLQERTSAKEKETQAKDLSLSMVQQKMMDEKIKEYQDKINGLQVTNGTQEQEIKDLKTQLALAQQKLDAMPSSDEIEFLRTGLKNASQQLKQKEEMLSQIKANTDEYVKEFKEQTQEFQSVKEQLQNAYDEINRRGEDLKYKNLEVVRLKERSTISVGDLQDQVNALTQKLGVVEKKFQGKTNENKVMALQAQLKNADAQIRDLQAQLNQFKSFSKNDPCSEKLKQALDKINEQGRAINLLAQKLQDRGQSVDLTKSNVK